MPRPVLALVALSLLSLPAFAQGGAAIAADGDHVYVLEGGVLYKVERASLGVVGHLALGSGPGGPHAGIYSHQTRVARSTDGGLTFREDDRLLFDHTSVPGAVHLASGRVLLAFVDAEHHGLDVAWSDDGGKTWERRDAAIEGEVAASSVDPCLVELERGSVRLYYYGGFAEGGGDPARRPGDHEMRSLRSTDRGETWVREEGVRYAAPEITDPDVFRLADGRWVMHCSRGQRLEVAVSSDGLAFRRHGELDLGGGVSGTIRLPDGSYRCYLSGRRIASIASDDGLVWRREKGTRLEGPVADPSPVIDPETGDFLLYYKRFGDAR